MRLMFGIIVVPTPTNVFSPTNLLHTPPTYDLTQSPDGKVSEWRWDWQHWQRPRHARLLHPPPALPVRHTKWQLHKVCPSATAIHASGNRFQSKAKEYQNPAVSWKSIHQAAKPFRTRAVTFLARKQQQVPHTIYALSGSVACRATSRTNTIFPQTNRATSHRKEQNSVADK